MKHLSLATFRFWATATAITLCGLGLSANVWAYTAVNVKFPCQQVSCDGDLWLPEGITKPPVIVMAHGFGAEKDWGLAPFAEAFVKAGFAVYRFDYRGFGNSGGKPRGVVNGKEHVKDWSAAVAAIKSRTDVDGTRMGLWGSSYSGGHVLALAAKQTKAFKAISVQVPFVSGLDSGLKYPLKLQPQAMWLGLRDMFRGDDEAPIMVPLASKDQFAVMVCAECDRYKDLAPAHRRDSLLTPARVFLTLPFYFPGSDARLIKIPTIIFAAENDGLVPVQGVRDVARDIVRADYVELKGADHFAPYFGDLLMTLSSRQVEFFKKHL